MNTKKIGDMGEDLAVQFLRQKGYRILDRNYRCRFGEIDIIAKLKSYYIFIEVKTRHASSYGRPIEAINGVKINRILKTINFYLSQNRIHDSDIRVDAIEVFLNDFNKAKINHIENIVC
ncbi:MAG: YraN family protein [Maledivibacter sp.]|nr:YraN family protein [Maledivibacter sp.]